jgi:hypothetical protein
MIRPMRAMAASRAAVPSGLSAAILLDDELRREVSPKRCDK